MSKTLPSYNSGTAEVPLLGMTIGEMLDRTAEKYPDNEALVCLHQNIRWTYKEFVEKVDEAARAFMAIGVKRGDRVGIWSPNRYEWTVTQFATAKVGAILVNINPAYGVHELQYALNLAGITVLVTADSFKASNYREMIYELAPELKRSAPGKLKADHVPELRAVINVHEDKHDGMWTWKEFLGFASDVSQEDLLKRQGELQFDDPINIQFTSGTTGNPKGATLTHHNILNNGYFVAESQLFTEKDRLVIPVPLYHCFGMVMGNLGCITHGSTMIYPGEGFEPKSVLQAVHQEKATALYGVPTMFIAELAEPEFETYDLSTLRTGIMAGARDNVEVGIAQPLGGAAHCRHAGIIEFHRVKAADFFELDLNAHGISDFLSLLPQAQLHVLDHLQLGAAEIDSENHFAGDHVARIGEDIDMTRCANRMRRMGPCDFVHRIQHPRHGKAGIAAHRHRGRPGVRILAGDRHLRPAQPLPMGDNANILAFGLKDRALFDMQLKEGVHLAGTNFFVAAPADPLQLITEFLAFRVFAVIGPVLCMDAGKNPGRQHRRGVTGAFLIGEIGHHNGVFCLDIHIVERAD